MQYFKNVWSKLGEKFKLKKNNKSEEIAKETSELPEEENLRRERYDFSDPIQRDQYVRSCLEQMTEASKELETIGHEYEAISMYLTDMEKIQDMNQNLREDLEHFAKEILRLEENSTRLEEQETLLSDEEFEKMERLEEFMPDAYNKIKEAEDYQVLVKRDLARLDGEKQAYRYRKNELINGQSNMKGMTLICLVSMSMLVVLLAILGSILELDVSMGIVIAVLVAAAALTLLFVKYTDATREISKIEKTNNKLILLHNTVKIRYVNNTNLLDFLYVKYDVTSAKTLKKLWDKYQTEVRNRHDKEENKKDLEFSRKGLLKTLRRANLEEPNIWVHQIGALLNEKDMTSMRHGLILQRTNLRKQMEYNARLCDEAQRQVNEIAQQYPSNAKYILDMLNDYQKACV